VTPVPPVTTPPVVTPPNVGNRPPYNGPIFIGFPGGNAITVVETGSSPINTVVETIVPFQYERFMTIKNATQERARFYVLLSDKNGKWLMSDGTAESAMVVELNPGQSYTLALGDRPLAAAKTRIWASTRTRNFLDYQDNDLWLVEMDASNQRRYQAPALETFTFNLLAK